jgi:hypothetical protein
MIQVIAHCVSHAKEAGVDRPEAVVEHVIDQTLEA